MATEVSQSDASVFATNQEFFMFRCGRRGSRNDLAVADTNFRVFPKKRDVHHTPVFVMTAKSRQFREPKLTVGWL